MEDPANFGIHKNNGAGKGDKSRTNTNSEAYQDSPLWARSKCCDDKVGWISEDGKTTAVCTNCAQLCETYQK